MHGSFAWYYSNYHGRGTEALADHNDGKVRHLTKELQWLLDHKRAFPEDTHDPSPLELFCEQNPDEHECLVYDD